MADKMDLNDNISSPSIPGQLAQEQLSESLDSIQKLKEKSPEAIIHELQVHQIELELQNDELRRVQLELEESRDRYQDLYDFAPVGYFTLTHKGFISEVNLTGARLLGAPRPKLINMRFGYFVAAESQDHYYEYILSVLKHDKKHVCDITLKREDGLPFYARLESMRKLLLVEKPGETEQTHVIRVAVSDISARKRMEEELLSAKKEWEQTFNSVPDLIAILNTEHKMVRVNQAMAERLGLDAEDCIGLACYEAVHGGEAPPDYCPHCKLLSDGEEHSVEVYVAGLGGDYMVTTSPLRDASGHVFGSVHVARDVTERRRAEDSLRESERFLRESEEKYRIIFREAPVGMMSVSKSGEIIEANRRILEILGSPGLEYTRKINMITSPRMIEAGIAEHYRRCVTEGIQADFETQYTTKWGKKTYLRSVVTPRFNDEGDVVGCLTVIEDVMQRKMAEDSLRESEQRYKALYSMMRLMCDNVPDLIWAKDLDRRFLFTNKAVCEKLLLASDTEEPVGKDDMFFVKRARESYPDNADWHTFGEVCTDSDAVVMSTQESQRFDEFGNVKGEFLYLDVYKAPFLNEQGQMIGTVGCGRDVTETRNLRIQLMRAQKMEAIGTLAGGIAHDFNNLLQVILGYSELMITNPTLPEQFNRGIKSINKAALSGADLVRRLLTVSRKAETRPAPLNLNDKIRQISQLLDRTIPKMIQIELKLSDSSTLISADGSQIEQIIMNLAVNASHAMPEGGNLVIETKTVFLDGAYCAANLEAKPGSYVLLSVSDSGHGMDNKTIERIFEPFFTTKGPGIGTGLGLAMVYGIVKQHGGHTTCDSEPGAGATFKIYFPSIGSALKFEKPVSLADAQGGTETILLVDDDERVRDVGREMLLEYGYRVVTASNGREALQIYGTKRESISLVILDLSMPEMGGAECLRALLSMDSKVRVLVATGYARQGIAEELKEAGATDFIAKPFDIPQLLEKIRNIIDK